MVETLPHSPTIFLTASLQFDLIVILNHFFGLMNINKYILKRKKYTIFAFLDINYVISMCIDNRYRY